MKIEDNPILQQIAQYLNDTLQMELLNQGHTASEALFGSIKTVVERTLTGITITTEALYYAKFVNAGRRPGTKGGPIDVLFNSSKRLENNIERFMDEYAEEQMQTIFNELAA